MPKVKKPLQVIIPVLLLLVVMAIIYFIQPVNTDGEYIARCENAVMDTIKPSIAGEFRNMERAGKSAGDFVRGAVDSQDLSGDLETIEFVCIVDGMGGVGVKTKTNDYIDYTAHNAIMFDKTIPNSEKGIKLIEYMIKLGQEQK